MSWPAIITFNLGDKIRISPPIWPNNTVEIQPGDLSQFAPQGNGVYGYQNPMRGNPFMSAPSQEACGGVIYFDNDIKREDFDALLRILQVSAPNKDFAAFAKESEEFGKEGYAAQLRLVSKFGLCHMFGAISSREYNSFPEQETSTSDTLWTFIEQERKRWGTSFGSGGLSGKFGGDGDYACEQLAFGFMLENDYFNICRIWSRAWLVTK